MKYGASASDYFDYEFFDKSNAAKSKFACYKLKRKFFNTMNDYSKKHIFDNKVEFLNIFQEYVGRDYLDMTDAAEEQFNNFVKKHQTFMVKAQTGSCGRGIYKVVLDESTDLKKLFAELKKGECLLEEVIVQHNTMSRLYSGCINSVRVGAIKTQEGIKILSACLRCGNGSDCIDNFCGGGLVAKIDSESGIIISDAVNRLHQRFYKHPTTDIMFHGFKIPHWDLIIQTVTKAMNVVDGVRYIGWDIAIRENDVVLIEGNFEGMFNVFQKPANHGVKTQIQEIISLSRGGNI